MSIKLKDVDLSTVSTSLQVDTQGKTITDCGWIEFANESPFTCDVNAGGINMPVLAWERHPIQLQIKNGPIWQPYQGADFPIVVTPRLLMAVDLTQFSTTLLTTLYMTGEQPTTIVPTSLFRQPNTVKTSGTTMSSSAIDNENNPTGTSILKTVVLGAPTNQNASNDGIWNLSVLIAGVLHQFLKTQASGSLLQLGNGTDITEILGELLVQGNLDVNGTSNLAALNALATSIVGTLTMNGHPISGASNYNGLIVDTSSSFIRFGVNTPGNLMDFTSGGDVFFKSGSASPNHFEFQSPNGSTVWSIASANGGIATCGAGTTISHGLINTPAFVVGTPVVTQPGSGTVGIAAFTGTTFKATVGAGGQILWYGQVF